MANTVVQISALGNFDFSDFRYVTSILIDVTLGVIINVILVKLLNYLFHKMKLDVNYKSINPRNWNPEITLRNKSPMMAQ